MFKKVGVFFTSVETLALQIPHLYPKHTRQPDPIMDWHYGLPGNVSHGCFFTSVCVHTLYIDSLLLHVAW